MLGRALGIALATAAYGLPFGALTTTAGFSVMQSVALSALVFSGASQLSAVSVVAAGGGVATAVGNGVLLSLRNAAYGVAMAPLLRGPLWRRLLGAQLVIDETTAMARAQPDEPRRGGRSGRPGCSCSSSGTSHARRRARGDALGDPKALGLDAIFPAAFVALLAPQLRQRGAPAAAAARPARDGGARPVRAARGADLRRRARRRRGPAPVSWGAILLLAAGVYATKALGPALLAGRPLLPAAERMLALVAVPLLAALVLVQTLTDGRSYVLDARLPAVLVAIAAVRIRAPFPLVVVLAAATCALVRAL